MRKKDNPLKEGRMTDHPNRQELIRAALHGTEKIADHLKSCKECRTLVELFATYKVAGELHLQDAPQAWIRNAAALAGSAGRVAKKLKQLAAALTFDSWATPSPVGVRGEGSVEDRRLRFELRDILLDLRAEKHTKGWNFTAQISGQSISTQSFVIVAGKKELSASEAGFYQWTSSRPPKRLLLKSESIEIETPEISWTTPHR